ncbi:MAG: SurA N-terminal domain-containing protein [Halioglobus sp.]
MLQDIRKSTKGTTAKVVVGLIVISFSIFGIESILLGGSGGGIAEVNGEEIYPEEVQQLVNTQKRRLISMMGENLDPAMLDDQLLSSQALDSIIARKLQMQSAGRLKMAISDKQIGAVIGSMEQFQIDGKFSPELYKSMLSGAGYTPAAFKQGLADDLLITQLNSGLAASDFATPAEVRLNAIYVGESRDIRYLTIPLEKFSADTQVSEDDILQYYEDNQLAFRTAESVELDYIKLSLDDFKQPVAESVLLEEYELQKENEQYSTESGVSHILFEQQSDETDETFQARVRSAQDKLSEGMDFAELAKAVSDDIGSAGFGGELGFTQGDAFPAEMEEAIALLTEVGAVSGPVVSDAGTHLIKLTERRDGKIPAFDELRAELEERVQTSEARREITRVVENLRDLAFVAEDLSGPAEELALQVVTSDPVTRAHPDGLFSNASLLQAAFSEEVLGQGHNSEVIELASETYVTLRVRKHNEPMVKPLDQVRDVIVANITDESARAAVASAAEQAIAELSSGVSLETYSVENDYDWQVELAANRGNGMIPRALLQRAFELSMPDQEKSAFDFVMTAEGDVQVFELARVTPGTVETLSDAQRQQLSQQITTEFARMANAEFLRGLRNVADITVL